jgi:urate oxidase
MGQGTNTILTQIAAHTLGLPYEWVDIATPDTAALPNSGPTVASRTCMVVGKLVVVLLKTSKSAFKGFVRDEYSTLKETRDRLFGTGIRAEWTCAQGAHDYGILGHRARTAILEVFANHDTRGVQHTLYETGKTLLERTPEATRIELSMPNRHCLLVDLAPFGLDHPNEVFVPIDEPYGLIEAVITRS